MDELAAFILARVAEDHDLAYQALHGPGAGGILGAHTQELPRSRHRPARRRRWPRAAAGSARLPQHESGPEKGHRGLCRETAPGCSRAEHRLGLRTDRGAGLHAHHPRATGPTLARPCRLLAALGCLSNAGTALTSPMPLGSDDNHPGYAF